MRLESVKPTIRGDVDGRESASVLPGVKLLGSSLRSLRLSLRVCMSLERATVVSCMVIVMMIIEVIVACNVADRTYIAAMRAIIV